MKKQNNSPFFALGQGITNFADYRALMLVGAPKDYTGQMITQIGALISQQDKESFAEDPEKKVFDFSKFKDFEKPTLDFDPYKLDPLGPITITGNQETPEKITPVKPPKTPILPPPVKNQIKEDLTNPNTSSVKQKGDDVHYHANYDGNAIGFRDPSKKSYITHKDDPEYHKLGAGTKMIIDAGSSIDKLGNYLSNMINMESIGDTVNQGVNWLFSLFQDDNSSFKRLRPEVLKIIDAFKYNKKGKKDTPFRRVAHITSSPFYQTTDKPYLYLRRAIMPKYAQQDLGSAAAEGFNLRVDAINYNRAVKAAFDKDLENELDGLNVPSPGDYTTSNQRNDLLEISLDSKKQLAEAFSLHTQGKLSKLEFEQKKDQLSSRINSISSSIKIFNDAAKSYAEKKGTIDPDASKPELTDFYETLNNAPESIGIKNINGQDFFIGNTIAGKKFKISVAQVANGNVKFDLVQKADIAAMSADTIKEMLSQKQEVRTAQGFGLAQYKDIPTVNKETGEMEKSYIRNVAENKIRTMLYADPNRARSLASTLSDGVMDYESYQNAIGVDLNGDGIVDNTEIKKNKDALYKDLASDFYTTYIEPAYNPQTFTTQRTTGTKGYRSSQKERERAQFIASWNKFPAPNKNNVTSYNQYLGNNGFNVVKNNNTGEYGVINIKTGKAVPGSLLDFEKMSPEQIKEKLLGYTGFLTFGNTVASPQRTADELVAQYLLQK